MGGTGTNRIDAMDVSVHGIRFVIAPPGTESDRDPAHTALVTVGPWADRDTPTGFSISSVESTVVLPGGTVRVRRGAPHLVEIDVPGRATADSLRHPFLAFPAAVIQSWLGRVVLHAGSFDVGDDVVVLLAHSGGGKSTTVAAAQALGFEARSDDVVVLDGRYVLPGPSIIDLRQEASEVFGGESLGRVGSRERWRIETEGATEPKPVALFVLLEWGDSVELEQLGAAELLQTLHHHSGLGVVTGSDLRLHTQLMFELLDVPFVRATRPRDHAAIPALIELLVRSVSGKAS